MTLLKLPQINTEKLVGGELAVIVSPQSTRLHSTNTDILITIIIKPGY